MILILANINIDATQSVKLALKYLSKVFVFIMTFTVGIPRLLICYIKNQLLHLNFMEW